MAKTHFIFHTGRKRDYGSGSLYCVQQSCQYDTMSAEAFHILYAPVTLQTHYSWMRESLLYMRVCFYAKYTFG
jgi:hypothetical protein